MNVDTGDVMRLNTTMAAGEELRVYTHFAGKRVVRLSGQTQSNAFSQLDTNSTFLQLDTGRNTLRYDAVANMDLLEVSIYYRPLFLGVVIVQLYVFDQTRNLCGYCSVLRNTCAGRAGSPHAAHLNSKPSPQLENLALLQIGSYLWKSDDEEAGIIEHENCTSG
jgi:hypothetical protein